MIVEVIGGDHATTPASDVRVLLREQIKTLRDRKVQLGGYRVGANWFHSDTFSRTQQMALVMMGAGMPADLKWKTMSGDFVAITPALAQQIFAAAAARDAALFFCADVLSRQVDAAEDPMAVDLSAGWPESFGGV
jgi:hypothetical protein